jgi:hypothetical protein
MDLKFFLSDNNVEHSLGFIVYDHNELEVTAETIAMIEVKAKLTTTINPLGTNRV